MKRRLFFLLRMLLCGSALHCAATSANPVPADEQSLQNGADAYELHCAVCHGSGPVDQGEQWYETSEYDVTPDFTDLVENAEAQKAATAKKLSEEEWPEWAEIPDPGNKADDAEVRAEILAELTRAIDEAYGTDVVSDDTGADEAGSLDFGAEFNRYYEGATADVADRVDGATNLADPDSFVYGTTEADLFESIASGTGVTMPGWRSELETDEAIWDLVNFIRSLWGDEWQDF